MIGAVRTWWTGQTPRERMLLLAAGGLALAVIVWLGVVNPVLAARADAERAYRTALTLYEEMTAGAREADRLRAAAPEGAGEGAAGSGEPLRAAASVAARDLGLEISRIQPGEDGALAFVFEAADPQDLFRWLDRVQSRYGASPATVTVRRNDNARTVQANILLLEAQ